MLQVAWSQVAEHWKGVSLGLSPGSVTKQLGSLYSWCLLSLLCRVVLQTCLDTRYSCRWQNLTQFYLHTHKTQSVCEKELAFQERRTEDTASHISYFCQVPERLSAETSSQALTSQPGSSRHPPTPCPIVGIFGKALFLLDSF